MPNHKEIYPREVTVTIPHGFWRQDVINFLNIHKNSFKVKSKSKDSWVFELKNRLQLFQFSSLFESFKLKYGQFNYIVAL